MASKPGIVSKPSLREMVAALVSHSTISSTDPAIDQGNRAAIDLLAEWLEALGADCAVQAVGARPDKANLIARLGSGEGGLALCGHADTVPCDPERWHSDPWELAEREGRWYGLGTSDMKAFLALAVEVAADWARQSLHAPLYVIVTADEECTMAGARTLAESGCPPAAAALIGEPSGLVPVYLHKGVMMESVRVIGRSGHASDPRLGRNALEGMQRVLAALLDWRTEAQRRWRHEAFAVPVPTLNLGRIHGGDSPNRICGECELEFDVRLLPGMEPEAVRAELSRRIQAALSDTGLRWEFRPLFPGIPAYELDPGSELARTAERLTGRRPAATTFGTEAPLFAAAGVPALILGPGELEQAHQPDESVAVEALAQARHLLNGFIAHYCR